MKVKDVCTQQVWTCRPQADVAAAARIMKHHGCGALPVIDDRGMTVGMISERDILAAAASMTDRSASEIPVGALPGSTPRPCGPEDGLEDALEMMREAKARRLPVLNAEGRLKGILSITDVAQALTDSGRTRAGSEGPTAEEVALTLKAVR